MNPSQSKRQSGQDDFVGGELDADLWKDSDIFIYIFCGKVGSSIAMLDLLQVRKGDLILGNCKITVELSNMVREALKSKIHGVEEAVRSTTKGNKETSARDCLHEVVKISLNT